MDKVDGKRVLTQPTLRRYRVLDEVYWGSGRDYFDDDETYMERLRGWLVPFLRGLDGKFDGNGAENGARKHGDISVSTAIRRQNGGK